MKRLESLDALRGFDMFFIMGGATLIVMIAGFFPENPFWRGLAEQMEHVSWEGLRHHDTIFPLFLFIAGASFPFSYAKQIEKGKTKAQICSKVATRAFILVFFGWICNGLLKFDFENLRICSVLSRIGLAWMCGAIIYMFVKDVKKIIIITTAILVGYWLILTFVPAPDAAGADVYSKQGCIACYIDRLILGSHCYRPEYDPEGLLSTIPAISTTLLGMLAGSYIKIQRKGFSDSRKALMLAITGIILALIGWIWGMVFPINKALWSSTFVCAVAGYSYIMLALFYYIIDVKGWKKWDKFFVVIGMNSITIYMIPRFISFRDTTHTLFDGIIKFCPEQLQGALMQSGYLLVCWLFLYFLYRHKIFLKV